LNPRPPEPHSGALPDCATSRQYSPQSIASASPLVTFAAGSLALLALAPSALSPFGSPALWLSRPLALSPFGSFPFLTLQLTTPNSICSSPLAFSFPSRANFLCNRRFNGDDSKHRHTKEMRAIGARTERKSRIERHSAATIAEWRPGIAHDDGGAARSQARRERVASFATCYIRLRKLCASDCSDAKPIVVRWAHDAAYDPSDDQHRDQDEQRHLQHDETQRSKRHQDAEHRAE
jgi:hypothetical protein